MGIRNSKYMIISKSSDYILDTWLSWTTEEAKKEFNKRWKNVAQNRNDIYLVKQQIINV